MIVGGHQNSETGFALTGADGNVRRIDFGVSVAVAVDRIVGHAVAKLNLDLRFREGVDVGLGVLRQPKHIGVVELQLGPSFITRRNAVARQHGRIERRRRPLAVIPALRRDVAMNQADAGNTVRLFWSGGVVGRIVCVRTVRTRVI